MSQQPTSPPPPSPPGAGGPAGPPGPAGAPTARGGYGSGQQGGQQGGQQSNGTGSADGERARVALNRLRAEVGKVVVGQDPAVTGLVIALLCRGTCCSRACRAWPRR